MPWTMWSANISRSALNKDRQVYAKTEFWSIVLKDWIRCSVLAPSYIRGGTGNSWTVSWNEFTMQRWRVRKHQQKQMQGSIILQTILCLLFTFGSLPKSRFSIKVKYGCKTWTIKHDVKTTHHKTFHNCHLCPNVNKWTSHFRQLWTVLQQTGLWLRAKRIHCHGNKMASEKTRESSLLLTHRYVQN